MHIYIYKLNSSYDYENSPKILSLSWRNSEEIEIIHRKVNMNNYFLSEIFSTMI